MRSADSGVKPSPESLTSITSRLFAEGPVAPDLPAAYYSWGVALSKHSDLAGAVARLELAHEKGPHWADPLKAWGDVLVKQGQRKDALAKYEEALHSYFAIADIGQASVTGLERTTLIDKTDGFQRRMI